jgi:acetate kinase
MKTIIINNGSTSKKYAVYEGDNFVYSVHYEKTPTGYALNTNEDGDDKNDSTEEISEKDFNAGFGHFVDLMLQKKIIESEDDIEKVAVRVVAPGAFFQQHKIVNKDYLEKLDDVAEISPLHIKPLQDEIDRVMDRISGVKIVAISDSAFHKTLSDVSKNYAIPKDLASELELYRYGYHGISVESVASQINSEKSIICHLGGGSSVTALKNGQSVDTSMGYSPLEGVAMSTRPGDIDPAVLLAIAEEKGFDNQEMQDFLYTQCGLKGLSGISNDTRDIIDAALNGDKQANLALDFYAYNVSKHIASYVMTLGGLDTLVFTGTIGERSAEIRSRILKYLEVFGVIFDKSKNKLQIEGNGEINTENSSVKIIIRHSDETAQMAKIAVKVE